jgi:hypothetical protein
VFQFDQERERDRESERERVSERDREKKVILRVRVIKKRSDREKMIKREKAIMSICICLFQFGYERECLSSIKREGVRERGFGLN